jgi:RNA polymerase sigma-32 factor
MGYKPDPAVIAEKLDVNEKEVIEMDRRLSSTEVSLDTPLGDGSDRSVTRLDLLSDEEQAGQDELVALEQFNAELAERLDEFGRGLKDKEEHIFRNRLLSPSPATLQEIGDHYGITRERVRQIEARLLKKLKAYLRERMAGYFEDEFLEEN